MFIACVLVSSKCLTKQRRVFCWRLLFKRFWFSMMGRKMHDVMHNSSSMCRQHIIDVLHTNSCVHISFWLNLESHIVIKNIIRMYTSSPMCRQHINYSCFAHMLMCLHLIWLNLESPSKNIIAMSMHWFLQCVWARHWLIAVLHTNSCVQILFCIGSI